MPRAAPDNLPDLIDVMKRTTAALRDEDVEVVLGGGLAIWARGGPATDHDVDLFVRAEHAEAALSVLERAGLRTERPPEGWLFKAWDGDVLVDLIFRPASGDVDDDLFRRADLLEVMAQPVLVASVDDVLASKLLALAEHNLDYRPALEIARALREQVRWAEVRRRCAGSPFALAFFTLVDALGIASRPGAALDVAGVTPLHRAAAARGPAGGV